MVRMPSSPTATDIGSYPEARLDGCTDPHEIGNGLLAGIVRIIPEEIAEMWAAMLNTSPIQVLGVGY